MCKKCEDVVAILYDVPQANENNNIFIYSIDYKMFVLNCDFYCYDWEECEDKQIYYCPFCGEKLIAEKCVKNFKKFKNVYKEMRTEDCLEEIESLQNLLDNIENKGRKVLPRDKTMCLEQIKELEKEIGELNV